MYWTVIAVQEYDEDGERVGSQRSVSARRSDRVARAVDAGGQVVDKAEAVFVVDHAIGVKVGWRIITSGQELTVQSVAPHMKNTPDGFTALGPFYDQVRCSQ